MPPSLKASLRSAQRAKQLVRLTRRFEESTISGYVLDVGPRFFLLALVSDRIRFDGFECFRIADIKKLVPDPRTKFVETALRKRGEKLSRKPRVDVSSLEKLLESAARAFPLIALHREEADPDVCWIGRIESLTRARVRLREITPDATWHDTPTDFSLAEITHINFGGDYEDALHLVGGNS